MKEMINVCLIGTGRAGLIHARNFSNALTHARLIALCDSDPGNLKAAAAELPVSCLYTDYREALANPAIDAVVVVTPTKFHKEIVIAAAEHKKHILCEKPMALTPADCEAMIAAAEAHGVKLQVGFMRRFDAGFRQAKEIVEAGEIGDVVLVKSLTRGPSEPKPWMFDMTLGPGPIGEVNSHDLDTLRWFADSEVESIYAIGANFRSPEAAGQYPDYYDTVSMNMTFENHVLGAVDGAQYVQYGYDARAEILGTTGCILIGSQNNQSVLTASKNGKISRTAMHSWTWLFREAYVNEARDFIECILHNTQPRVTGHDGKMAVQLVDCGFKSLMEKRIVRTNET